MKIETWAPIAEIASSLAVVATLCVLILEVRDNTAASVRQATIQSAEETLGDFYRSPYLPMIQMKVYAVDGASDGVKALVARYGMSEEEAIRWSRYMLCEWTRLLADYRYFGDNARIRETILRQFKFADQQIYWEASAKRFLPKDFVAFVESVRTEK